MGFEIIVGYLSKKDPQGFKQIYRLVMQFSHAIKP